MESDYLPKRVLNNTGFLELVCAFFFREQSYVADPCNGFPCDLAKTITDRRVFRLFQLFIYLDVRGSFPNHLMPLEGMSVYSKMI